ncbi:MAG: hypothetical protein RLZZ475_2582, partial [Pseudomonadota bacterium]
MQQPEPGLEEQVPPAAEPAPGEEAAEAADALGALREDIAILIE